MTQEQSQNVTELEQLLSTFSIDQLDYVAVRPFVRFDKDAAEKIGVARETVSRWENKDDVDKAVKLIKMDGVAVAREMRRRNLVRAMKVKLDGLDLDDDRLRQAVATEIIEWELGKAPQRVEADVTTKRDEPNFSDWTPDELRNFVRLVEKATGQGVGGAGSKEPD